MTSRTVYLGPEASFSHQAVLEYLPQTGPSPLASFSQILEAIENDTSEYGVLPVENSTNGSVVQALDLLARCGRSSTTSTYPNVEVVDEYYLQVHHCVFVSRQWARHILASEEYEDVVFNHDRQTSSPNIGRILNKLRVQDIHSHPQVWGQCTRFLDEYLPPARVERINTSSTSAAAAHVTAAYLDHPKEVREDMASQTSLAVASPLAGVKHKDDLLCLARNIEDEPGANTTRFLVLQNRCRRMTDGVSETNHTPLQSQIMKSLLTFTTSHTQPGSLASALAVFAKNNFNLSAIHSRPRSKTQIPRNGKDTTSQSSVEDDRWKYIFFVECLHTHDKTSSTPTRMSLSVQHLLDELEVVTEEVNLLGTWPDRLVRG